jgi:tRNA 5-methylaminomethyl-2-thiouridine biosynthesis bifunctional protein
LTNPEKHALVIGAGLAGAATCAALVRRGWRTTLIDAASGPAQAASALPVGMLSPHVTRAPTPLSRLSALGVASTRAELVRLIPQGRGWQDCEVDNLGHDKGRWPAALVRPGALVQAWLDEAEQPGALVTRWRSCVERLERSGGQWRALDGSGSAVASAPVVVVASALGSLGLLRSSVAGIGLDTLPLRPVKGQMSLSALQGVPLAERPQRDRGVFVPVYEDAGLPPQWPARIWAMGSTYERGVMSTSVEQGAHERNAHSLEALNPDAADRMRKSSEEDTLLGWAEVRCASLDRLPLVGAVPDVPALRAAMAQRGSQRARLPLEKVPHCPGLFVLSALGSRGLTLAHWCAELLARQIDGAPPDAAPDLVSALDPARFVWRQTRKRPVLSAS